MSAFDLLHPALQHHIVNSLGWSSLRPFQEAAIPHLLEGKHALVLAPTAGGKTESVVFPLLSRILSEPWSGLSVLYLCPIKALINDLGVRLGRYFRLVGRRAELWHGDVTRSNKKRMLDDPPDLLLTTPESLEAILTSSLVNGPEFLRGARAVVVDEVHAFAGDDRGWHVASLLARLSRICSREFQRLGLSATAGNPEDLLLWLTAGCAGAKVVLHPPDVEQPKAEVKLDYVGSLDNASHIVSRLFRGEKRLVFVDSRARAEQLGSELHARGTKVFVTHSSLSKDQRKQAEDAFRSAHDCVIVATSVLELGVDVGDLDRVIQLDAPGSVSSFLQRMGRTGRRKGGTRNCLFLATNEQALLQAAAIAQLFESGYVEPVVPPAKPYHILAQQLMALILQQRGVGKATWFQCLKSVPAFDELELGFPDSLVCWMLDRGILTEEQGVLWIGRQGEESYGRKNFMSLLSVFVSPPVFAVLHGRDELGSINERAILQGSGGERTLLLGGRPWRVTHVDWKRRRVHVEPASGEGTAWWPGDSPGISFQVSQSLKKILCSERDSALWSSRATHAINAVRQSLPWLKEENCTYLVSELKATCWWTFAGGDANAALAGGLTELGVKPSSHDNLRIRFLTDSSAAAVADAVDSLCSGESLPVPNVDKKAIAGLSFSDVIPDDLALSILQARASDVFAIDSVLQQQTQSVSGC